MTSQKTLSKLTSYRKDGWNFKLKPDSLSKVELKSVIDTILFNYVEDYVLDYKFLNSIKVEIKKEISIVEEQVNNGSEHLIQYLFDKQETLILFNDYLRYSHVFTKKELVKFFRFIKPYISEELSNRLKWYQIK